MKSSSHRICCGVLSVAGIMSALPIDCFGQNVPEQVRRVSATQLSRLIERAAAEELLVTELRAYQTRNQILFSASFTANEHGHEWLSRLNLSPDQMNEFTAECLAKGYEQTARTSVRLRGRSYYSGIWVRKTDQTAALVLPAAALPETGRSHESLAGIDQFMRTFLVQHNVAGATVAVMRDGRLVYARGFGYASVAELKPMQPNSVSRIASLSKSLTAVATLMLAEQGQLDLQEKVLPILRAGGFPKLSRDADQRWRNITVQHLLQHTGGWDRSVSDDPLFGTVHIGRIQQLNRPVTASDVVRYQLTQPLDFDPGQKHVYANFGFALLGQIIETRTGKSYRQWMTETLINPCGMQHTRPGFTKVERRGEDEVSYHMQNEERHQPFWQATASGRNFQIPDPLPEPDGRWDLNVMLASGGWVSTAPDLLRFVRMLDDSQSPLLRQDSLALMVSPPNIESTPNRGYWYGSGWNVRGHYQPDAPLAHCDIWHYGVLAGTAALLVRRNDGFAWAVLFNTDESRDGRKLNALVDRDMHRVVESVVSWPDHDLFDTL